MDEWQRMYAAAPGDHFPVADNLFRGPVAAFDQHVSPATLPAYRRAQEELASFVRAKVGAGGTAKGFAVSALPAFRL